MASWLATPAEALEVVTAAVAAAMTVPPDGLAAVVAASKVPLSAWAEEIAAPTVTRAAGAQAVVETAPEKTLNVDLCQFQSFYQTLPLVLRDS